MRRIENAKKKTYEEKILYNYYKKDYFATWILKNIESSSTYTTNRVTTT